MRANEFIFNENDHEYRGEHTAPGKEDAPLYDVTANGIYPADFYSNKGLHYYGSGDPYDSPAFYLILACRNRPNKPVKIYRAVPTKPSPAKELAKLEKQMHEFMRRGVMPSDSYFSNGAQWYEWAHKEKEKLAMLSEPTQEKMTINPGDWVAIDRKYAKDHGESVLNGNYKILSKTVPARELYTDGNSIREWGWNP